MLAPFTTLKIGGKARFFVSAKTENEIIEAVRFAEANDFEIFVLGGGSNVLIADEGFDGLVLKADLRGVSESGEKDGTTFITAQAGEDWDEFVCFCVERNLAGIECLSGIPGFVGGTPVQNVGAYGQEVSETIVNVRVFDRKTKETLELTNADCKFAYRASIFNTTEKNRFIVLAVTFALKAGGEPKVTYKDLQQFFGENKPALMKVRQAVLQIRRAKSMVIDADDPNSRSVGSFFKNPVVNAEKFNAIEKFARERQLISADEHIPKFTMDGENVKIPAAWLIEKSGFHKGFRKANVAISTKHSLAIVNLGNATAKDVLDFKDEIQARVSEMFGVELTPEPLFIGKIRK